MLTLILETSTEKGLIVLAEKGTPLTFQALLGGPNLSKNLALEVKKLLDGKKPDLIAVGTGPGSYTGIRVGAALGKALAYGWSVPLLGFCSLKAFGRAPVLIDARMGGFYALLDDTPLLIQPDDPRLKNLAKISTPHPEMIQKRLSSEAILEAKEPDPKGLSELVWTLFLEGKTGGLELTYLSTP
jgi:tRNA threonylcarbamoyl adenosine modification protein YeaZ